MNKVRKGFSEKDDGSMYVTLTNAVPENIAHRKTFWEKRGLSGKQVAVADTVHGIRVAVIDRQSPYLIPQTDALITRASDIVLALTGADCFPVYFEEKMAGIVGLAHCGWRGIIGGIVAETIASIENAGGKKENIIITIGPGICAKHFEIREDALPSFLEYPECVSYEEGIHVDLPGIIEKQARASGVISEYIKNSGECTYCLPEKYFSFRRDKPKILENHIAYIVQFSHRKF
jgi:YfiH family protein